MSNKKFSEFTLQTDNSNVAFVVGFNGSDNVRISPSNLIGSGFLPVSGGTMTGNLLLQDNIQVQIGTGADLKLYHNGTDSFIENQTGILKIQSSVTDGDIQFLSDDGSGTATTYFKLDGGNVNVSIAKDFLFQDNVKGIFGNSSDLLIYHDATDSQIFNKVGDLVIRNDQNDGDIRFLSDDGGGGTTEYFKLDGTNKRTKFSEDILLTDDKRIRAGSGADFSFFHDGSNSKINNNTGNIVVENFQDDGDISFKTDDGSGGTTEYFRLDGGDTITRVAKNFRANDNVALQVGVDGDAGMYHDGTNTYFQNDTGNLILLQNTNDGDIIFKSDNGSGGTTTYMTIDGGSENVQFAKSLFLYDNIFLNIGGSFDLRLYHDGNSNIKAQGSGNLIIAQTVDDADIVFKCDDGSGGITEYFKLDGSLATHDGSDTTALSTVWVDNSKVVVGDGADGRYWHDGTNTYLQNTTGDLIIENFADDKDIILKSDDGSGGVTPYLTLDGGNVRTEFKKEARFDDNVALKIGSSGDLSLSHDATNTRIENFTGALKIINNTDDGDIEFFCDDGSGGLAKYFYLDGSTKQIIFEEETKHQDNVKAKFGTSSDLSIFHNATDTFIDNSTGSLNIRNQQDDGDINFICDNGSGGNATYFSVDGGGTDVNFFKDTHHIDNVKAKFGSDSSGDLQIYHNSTDSVIDNNTGDLYITNKADDKAIIFRSDDGSGGFTNYMQIDGANEVNKFHKHAQFLDSIEAKFGNGGDLRIYHDGSNSYIEDSGTGDLFIKASNDIYLQGANNEFMAEFSENGSVDLYYDGNKKFETTSSGVDVTGIMAINDGNNNVSIGDSAGDSITSGDRNTLVGHLAGTALTTGQYNIAIGYEALENEDTGNRALAIGYQALYSQNNDTDTYNTAVGFQTGYSVTTGVQNTILGAFAGDALTTGSNNVAIGNNALSTEDAHGRNVAVGHNALQTQNAGADAYNVAMGYNCGKAITTGTENILIGGNTGLALTTGERNVAIGHAALQNEDGNGYNVAVGNRALQNLNAGADAYNVAVGSNAGQSITDGINNTIIGGLAGDAITTADSNIAIGKEAMTSNVTSGRNVAIGQAALRDMDNAGNAYNIGIGYAAGMTITSATANTLIGGLAGDAITTGSNNVSIGYQSLSAEDSGGRNIAIGYRALQVQDAGTDAYNVAIGYNGGNNITTGINNTLIGGLAGDALTTGTGNTTVGYQALSAEDTLDGNTAIGYQSLKVQDGGSFNTSIGYQSGVAVSTGDENTFLGAKAGDAVTTGSNLTVIGYNAAASAVGASDEITLGDANVDTLRCATQTISALSDKRDKTNIQESTYGLDFIDKLNPVTFDWNTRDGSRKGKKDLGFIAQELDAVDDEYTQLVYKSNPDKLEASYGRLVPVLVKAIQELKQEIEHLKNK